VLDIFYIAGADAPIKQMPRYLRIGAAGEVRHWHKSCFALSSYGGDSWPFAVAVLDPNTGNAQRITSPFFLEVVFAGWTR
jgi:hypothetical protein